MLSIFIYNISLSRQLKSAQYHEMIELKYIYNKHWLDF